MPGAGVFFGVSGVAPDYLTSSKLLGLPKIPGKGQGASPERWKI